MKQKEIKLPFSCNTSYRLIVLSLTIIFNLIIFIFSKVNNWEFYFWFNLMLGIMWAVIEISIWAGTKAWNDEPILPFRFKCKCEDNKK